MRISDWSSDVCSSDLLAIVVAFIVLSILRWRAAMIATGKAAERMFQLEEEADARQRMDNAGADARDDGASKRPHYGTLSAGRSPGHCRVQPGGRERGV